MNGLEKQTATLLRQMGLRYRSQYRPGEGIAPVDFYLRDLKTVIEVDGDYWHSPLHFPDRPLRDAEKVKRLEARGFKVVRLKESEMKNGSATKIIKGVTRVARFKKAVGKAAGAAGKAAGKAGKAAGKAGGTFAGAFAQQAAAAAAGILVDVLVEKMAEHFSRGKGDEPPPEPPPGPAPKGNGTGPRPAAPGASAGPDVQGQGFSGSRKDWS
jgi:very-short-patch-repair endonuclease